VSLVQRVFAVVRRRRTTVTRVLRCLSVSVGTTIFSAVILIGLAIGAGVPAGTANFAAVACGIPPSYLGNRRWVWQRRGRGNLRREILPFWVLSLLGLVASSFFVGRVGSMIGSWSAPVRAATLPAASVGVLGVLWVAQFALLDRVIFRDRKLAGAPVQTSPHVPQEIAA